MKSFLCILATILPFGVNAYSTPKQTFGNANVNANTNAITNPNQHPEPCRRTFLQKATASIIMPSIIAATASSTLNPPPADAIGPVKLLLKVKSYSARICPPDRPIPGEKAMKGMKGLCVTVLAEVADEAPKDLSKIGVYGFVIDGITGDSVLANNPDGGSDAGQFAMIETITPKTKEVEFEFIAAVPMEKDLSKFDNGIGKLDFKSLRVVSFPGGQQYGAVNPCEMNEFSDECEKWETENGPYEKAEYMIKSNSRTKGR
jgi:hypothetical protein